MIQFKTKGDVHRQKRQKGTYIICHESTITTYGRNGGKENGTPPMTKGDVTKGDVHYLSTFGWKIGEQVIQFK